MSQGIPVKSSKVYKQIVLDCCCKLQFRPIRGSAQSSDRQVLNRKRRWRWILSVFQSQCYCSPWILGPRLLDEDRLECFTKTVFHDELVGTGDGTLDAYLIIELTLSCTLLGFLLAIECIQLHTFWA
eukprot:s1026_g15.t1